MFKPNLGFRNTFFFHFAIARYWIKKNLFPAFQPICCCALFQRDKSAHAQFWIPELFLFQRDCSPEIVKQEPSYWTCPLGLAELPTGVAGNLNPRFFPFIFSCEIKKKYLGRLYAHRFRLVQNMLMQQQLCLENSSTQWLFPFLPQNSPWCPDVQSCGFPGEVRPMQIVPMQILTWVQNQRTWHHWRAHHPWPYLISSKTKENPFSFKIWKQQTSFF